MNNQNYQNNYIQQSSDVFDYLRAIASGSTPPPTLSSNVRFWAHEPNEPLIGIICGFDSFEHPQYGTQDTVIVELENGELVSAILTDYLKKGMAMQNGTVGDGILIVKQGQERSKHGKIYNVFQIVIQKLN